MTVATGKWGITQSTTNGAVMIAAISGNLYSSIQNQDTVPLVISFPDDENLGPVSLLPAYATGWAGGEWNTINYPAYTGRVLITSLNAGIASHKFSCSSSKKAPTGGWNPRTWQEQLASLE